jgi:hypothetical protein
MSDEKSGEFSGLFRRMRFYPPYDLRSTQQAKNGMAGATFSCDPQGGVSVE